MCCTFICSSNIAWLRSIWCTICEMLDYPVALYAMLSTILTTYVIWVPKIRRYMWIAILYALLCPEMWRMWLCQTPINPANFQTDNTKPTNIYIHLHTSDQTPCYCGNTPGDGGGLWHSDHLCSEFIWGMRVKEVQITHHSIDGRLLC